MFVDINQQVSQIFDIISEMMKPVMLNYGVLNFTLKDMIVLLYSWLILCQLTIEFQLDEMQENIWPSTQSIENFKYEKIRNIQIRHFFSKSEDRTLLIY